MTGAPKIQIICSTHSPHFVGIDRLDQIRLVRKIANDTGGPMITYISNTTLDHVASMLNAAYENNSETRQNLERRLQTIMTPVMNEGFFADLIVLVEGEGDRAALTAIAKSKNYSLDGHGITIISCHSKNNLASPAMIFRCLDIPIYVVWDEDYEKQGDALNHKLLSVINQQQAGRLSGVHKYYACLNDKLENVITRSLGDHKEEYVKRCISELHVHDVLKKPHAITYLLKIAKDEGISFPDLEDIVDNIIKLRFDNV